MSLHAVWDFDQTNHFHMLLDISMYDIYCATSHKEVAKEEVLFCMFISKT